MIQEMFCWDKIDTTQIKIKLLLLFLFNMITIAFYDQYIVQTTVSFVIRQLKYTQNTPKEKLTMTL